MVYHYDWALAVDPATGNPAPGASFDFYDVSGGTLQAVTDYNGTPLAHLVATSDGIIPRFQHATLTRGYLYNGSYYIPILSLEAQDGAAAVVSAASAQAAASDSAAAANTAAANASNAATSAASSAAIASAQPGMATLIQNGDGTWPDRRTVTTDRTKIIGLIATDMGNLPGTAPVVTSGSGLALPTPYDLLGWASPS